MDQSVTLASVLGELDGFGSSGLSANAGAYVAQRNREKHAQEIEEARNRQLAALGMKRGKMKKEESPSDEEWNEDKPKRRKVKKRESSVHQSVAQWKRHVEIATTQKIMEMQLNEYHNLVPWPENQSDSLALKTTVNEVLALDELRKASGGFIKFINAHNDLSLQRTLDIVRSRYQIDKSNTPLNIARILRHVWNSTPVRYRMEWEKKVRKEIFQSEDSDKTMPLCEFPVTGSMKSSNEPVVEMNCCGKRHIFSNSQQFMSHFLGSHDSVKLYACTYCRKAFVTEKELTVHTGCQFAQVFIENALSGKSTDVNTVTILLSCLDCALCFPLKPFPSPAAWNYLCTLMKLHRHSSIVPIQILYYHNGPEKVQLESVDVTFTRFMNCEVPYDCKECDITFKSLEEADSHFLEKHPDKCKTCTKCGDTVETFGSELSYRIHTTKLVKESVISNFLKYSAVYHPAPYSQRLPHVGNDPSAIIMKDVLSDDGKLMSYGQYVSPEEDTVREKIFNCLSIKADDDFVVRPDIGYENFDYSEFEDDAALDAQKLQVLKKLNIDPSSLKTVRMAKVDKKVMSEIENSPTSEVSIATNETSDQFVASVCNALKTSVKIILSKGLDPLKGSLLVGQKFVYCEGCVSVHSVSQEQHVIASGKCSDAIQKVIFNPSKAPHSGVECVVDGCQEDPLCTIHGLRIHAQVAHGLNIELIKDPLNTTSIMVVSRCGSSFSYGPATVTNSTLGLPTGVLELKKEFVLTRPVCRVDLLPKLEYTCNMCNTVLPLGRMKDHLITQHMNLCCICGHMFVSSMSFRQHQQYCKVTSRTPAVVPCQPCGELLDFRSPVTIKRHIVEKHVEWMRCTDNEVIPTYDYNLVKQPTQPLMNVPTRVSYVTSAVTKVNQNNTYVVNERDETNLKDTTCFLCGMVHWNEASLTQHLNNHPENFKKCTYCPAPVQSLREFEHHLNNAHSFTTGQQTKCQFCQTVLVDKSAAQHLMYECVRTPSCWLCNQPNVNWTKHKEHMTTHFEKIHRFKCESCQSSFTTIWHFKEHSCRIIHGCDCDKRQRFSTKNDFLRHYRGHHSVLRQMKTMCSICQHIFKYPSNELQFRAHAMLHCHAITFGRPAECTVIGTSAASRPHFAGRNGSNAMIGQVLNANQNSNIQVKRPVETVITLDDDDDDDDSAKMDTNNATENLAIPSNLSDILNNINEVVTKNKLDVVSTSPSSNGNESREKSKSPTVEPDPDDDGVAVRNMTAEVREETQDAGYEGASCSVEDDDDDIVAVEPVVISASGQTSAPVLKTVHDENGDDEISIVAEMEPVASNAATNAAPATGREKTLPCGQCSEKFITQAARQTHLDKAHAIDAGGGLCEETFELPQDVEGFICRNCSLVFESEYQFWQHVRRHSPAFLLCNSCSGFAFSEQLQDRHQRFHHDLNTFFACGRCLFKFPTDASLMRHLSTHHKVPMFFFCKSCGYGELDINQVTRHIFTAKHNDHMCTIDRLGVCPASMLSFEPENVESYKKLLAKGINTVPMSDCSHRSLLLAVEPLVSCETCDCTMSTATFFALHNGNTNPRSEIESRFPFMSMLKGENSRLITESFRNAKKRGVRGTCRITVRLPDLKEILIKTSREPSVKISTRNNTPKMINESGGPSATVTITETPIDLAAALGSSFSINNVEAVDQPSSSSPSVTRRHAPRIHGLEKWARLKKPMSKRHTEVCSICFTAFTTERHLLVHFFNAHHFSRPRYSLKCKMCPQVFDRVDKYVNHRNLHGRDGKLQFLTPGCKARFETGPQRDKHANDHNRFLSKFDMESTCCNICHSVDTWCHSLRDEASGQEVMLSHMMVHGFERQLACRECYIMFDKNEKAAENHLRIKHQSKAGIIVQIYHPREIPLLITTEEC